MTFVESFRIILQAMMGSISKNLKVTEEQMKSFINDFYHGLPDYMQSALARAA